MSFALTKTRLLLGLAGLLLSVAVVFAAEGDELPARLEGHGGPIKAIAISPDGKRALTASFDYAIISWDLSTSNGRVNHRLIGHDSAVNDVAFVPGHDLLVSVSDDGSLAIWSLATGEMIARIKSTAHKVLDVDVSADGKLAAVARWDGTARIYDLALQKEVAVLEGHRGNVNAVAFSKDSRHLYSAAYDGQIIEWDVGTARQVRPIYRHGWGVNSIARIDDDRIVFGALDGTVAIVSISKADKIADLAKRQRPVQSVKVSHNGKLLGFADGAGRIEVFQADTLKPVEGTEVAYGPVWDFDFVPGTTQLYHVGLDDFAIRWQISPRRLSTIESKFPRRFQIRKTDDPGELEFQRKCSVCHTLTPDSANRAGPTLYNVFGRRAGTLNGYRYSQALLNSDVVWNEITIGRLFDDGPDVMMPGTKMPIQRLKSVTRRDDLIRFLKTATSPAK